MQSFSEGRQTHPGVYPYNEQAQKEIWKGNLISLQTDCEGDLRKEGRNRLLLYG
jgi:hypothetical protein